MYVSIGSVSAKARGVTTVWVTLPFLRAILLLYRDGRNREN